MLDTFCENTGGILIYKESHPPVLEPARIIEGDGSILVTEARISGQHSHLHEHLETVAYTEYEPAVRYEILQFFFQVGQDLVGQYFAGSDVVAERKPPGTKKIL